MRPQTRIMYSLSDRITGQGARSAPKGYCLTSRGAPPGYQGAEPLGWFTFGPATGGNPESEPAHERRTGNGNSMDSIDTLPDAILRAGSPVAEAFLARGLRTFRHACEWVRALPYGSNSRTGNAMVLFEECRGTCFTKHGAIARLAAELDLDVHKTLGFYRLNEDIVTGVADLLRPHGLDFVPATHCFLEHRTFRVDLTAGNRTGKNKDLEEFDFMVRVGPESSRDEIQRYYATYFAKYSSIDPRLGVLGLAAVRELVEKCHRLAAACRCPDARESRVRVLRPRRTEGARGPGSSRPVS